MNKNEIKYTKGSANVYKDIGFPDAEERYAKARLAIRLNEIINERKLKQIEVAEILGITQPKVSALMNGHLSGISMEKLIYFLNRLSQDVEIIIKSKSGRAYTQGKLKIAFG